jgi:hypothetical protein
MQTIANTDVTEDLDEGLRDWWRRTYLVREGSAKDARLRELLSDHYGVGGSQIRAPMGNGAFVALITWEQQHNKA